MEKACEVESGTQAVWSLEWVRGEMEGVKTKVELFNALFVWASGRSVELVKASSPDGNKRLEITHMSCLTTTNWDEQALLENVRGCEKEGCGPCGTFSHSRVKASSVPHLVRNGDGCGLGPGTNSKRPFMLVVKPKLGTKLRPEKAITMRHTPAPFQARDI